jgi:lysozyme
MLSTSKKKVLRYSVLSFTLLVIVSLIVFVLVQKIFFTKDRFVRYPEFGIPVPTGYAIHGIDVSKYQSKIDWEEVKAMNVKGIQMRFAFIKATEGTNNSDPQFKRNWLKSKETGIVRGAYHFFIASRDGKQQAENFIDEVELDKGDLPPVLDIEQLNGTSIEELRKEAKKWLEAVEEHYNVKPIIYTNVAFYTNYLGQEFDKYTFWAAHYHSTGKPRIERDWHFWQHSDQGRVNGIRTPVDFNVFNGDWYQFLNLLVD